MVCVRMPRAVLCPPPRTPGTLPPGSALLALRSTPAACAWLETGRHVGVPDNPTLVVVTDRTDLDKQITDTFLRCGYPNPERAGGMKELRALLEHPTGKTVTTTIQKFQELTSAAGKARRAPRPCPTWTMRAGSGRSGAPPRPASMTSA